MTNPKVDRRFRRLERRHVINSFVHDLGASLKSSAYKARQRLAEIPPPWIPPPPPGASSGGCCPDDLSDPAIAIHPTSSASHRKKRPRSPSIEATEAEDEKCDGKCPGVSSSPLCSLATGKDLGSTTVDPIAPSSYLFGFSCTSDGSDDSFGPSCWEPILVMVHDDSSLPSARQKPHHPLMKAIEWHREGDIAPLMLSGGWHESWQEAWKRRQVLDSVSSICRTVLNPLPTIHLMLAFLTYGSSSLKPLFREDEWCALQAIERLPPLSQLLFALLWYQWAHDLMPNKSKFLPNLPLELVSLVARGQGLEGRVESLVAATWVQELMNQGLIEMKTRKRCQVVCLNGRVREAVEKLVILCSSSPFYSPPGVRSMCLGETSLPSISQFEERVNWAITCFPTQKHLSQLIDARAWRRECGEHGGNDLHFRVVWCEAQTCTWNVVGEGPCVVLVVDFNSYGV